jgi:hypothetical protein
VTGRLLALARAVMRRDVLLRLAGLAAVCSVVALVTLLLLAAGKVP